MLFIKKLFLFFFAFISILLNVVFIGKELIADGDWISKINDSYVISYKQFNDLYEATILMMQMNSPIPSKKEDIKATLEDNEKKKVFLKSLEDQVLIIEKAKEKKIVNDESLDQTLKPFYESIKNQYIVKKFIDEYIYPRISITDKEVNLAYSNALKEKNSKLKGIPIERAKLFVKQSLLVQKMKLRFSMYVEKLRLEAKIIQNKSYLR